jgi:hypothetical protein
MESRILKHAEVLFAFGLIMVCCSEVKSTGPSPENNPHDLSKPGFVMNLNAGLEIPENDIPPLEEAALHGSGASALKLALFYGLIKKDSDQYSYWTTISAEDGDVVGIHNLAHVLLRGRNGEKKSDRNSEIRARFWLERSAKAGSTLSQAELKDMGNKGLEQPHQSTWFILEIPAPSPL